MTPQDRERLEDKYHEAVQEIKELTDEYNAAVDENERLNNVIADSIIETQQLRAKSCEAMTPLGCQHPNQANVQKIMKENVELRAKLSVSESEITRLQGELIRVAHEPEHFIFGIEGDEHPAAPDLDEQNVSGSIPWVPLPEPENHHEYDEEGDENNELQDN